MNTRQITGIVIHCSGTPDGQWINAHEIDQAHLALGFKRDEGYRQRFNSLLHAVGYHFIVYPNGASATGRHLKEPGQHTKTHNQKTVAICLVGTNKFTQAQWSMLRDLVKLLTIEKYFPGARVAGCNELPGEDRNSPGFSVAEWQAIGMQPLPDHIYIGTDSIRPEPISGALT
ncbi:MAG: N-acetylmuramoyl-L-alanine amidase [Nitrosomonas sp.]|nr:N-acetylmuramoyl-L-alanine amidase [Nitrosomonas sp.]